MAILVDKDTECIVQGITGKQGSFHTKLMLDYGTKIVGGCTPGKGGQEVHGLPVYDTVRECMERHPNVTCTSIWVPAAFTKDAVLEAIDAELKTVVIITERIPIHDMLVIRKKAKEKNVIVLGGNTPGVISPGKAKVGMLPESAFTEGRIGTVSRSGSITYYLGNTLALAGRGASTCVGIGGDPLIGTGYEPILKLFEEDPETNGILLAGEIGGIYEEMAADFIKTMKKPVVAYITGLQAPKGKRMGHAGAIIERGMGTAQSKVSALREAGARIATTFSDIPRLLEERGV
ncbi:MAG: succinate--CoA ligase subunit alpha [Theionarchaea archaeon]|nr:succinate--CoA ligase subunit alpha [Theionarchaea archaeon]